MKKSTLIIAALIFFSLGVLRAEEGLSNGEGAQGSAPAAQEPPLLLAASLPAMSPHLQANPVRLLPGMSPVKSAAVGLPQPLITDLTNAPNPFDSRKGGLEGQTQISYQLVKDARVTVEIYSLLGNKVRGWNFAAGVNGGRQGVNTLLWDGTNEAGQKVSKGGYLAEIVIETPETTVTAIRKIGVIH